MDNGLMYGACQIHVNHCHTVWDLRYIHNDIKCQQSDHVSKDHGARCGEQLYSLPSTHVNAYTGSSECV